MEEEQQDKPPDLINAWGKIARAFKPGTDNHDRGSWEFALSQQAAHMDDNDNPGRLHLREIPPPVIKWINDNHDSDPDAASLSGSLLNRLAHMPRHDVHTPLDPGSFTTLPPLGQWLRENARNGDPDARALLDKMFPKKEWIPSEMVA
jgi:hypothetical protein